MERAVERIFNGWQVEVRLSVRRFSEEVMVNLVLHQVGFAFIVLHCVGFSTGLFICYCERPHYLLLPTADATCYGMTCHDNATQHESGHDVRLREWPSAVF